MKKVKLGQVATFINGYAFKPQDWSSEGKEIIRISSSSVLLTNFIINISVIGSMPKARQSTVWASKTLPSLMMRFGYT